MKLIWTAMLTLALPAMGYANCLDLNGSYTGTCERTVNGQVIDIPAKTSIHIDGSCSKLSLTGFHLPSPGVKGLILESSMDSHSYQHMFNGVMNLGNTNISGHYNDAENSLLIVSTNTLVSYSVNNPQPIPPERRTRSTTIQTTRIYKEAGGDLISESKSQIYAHYNGGDQMLSTIDDHCVMQ